MTSIPPERRGIALAIRILSFNIGFLISLNIVVISLVQVISYEAATRLIIMEGTANIKENIAANNLANAIAGAFQTQATIMPAGIPFSLVLTNENK